MKINFRPLTATEAKDGSGHKSASKLLETLTRHQNYINFGNKNKNISKA
jgi:hypothetical protein